MSLGGAVVDAGQRVLRTTDRNVATGVSGLHDPAERAPPADDLALLGGSL
jgi:hypothetical protein